MNFRLTRDQAVLLKTVANLRVSRRKANDFFSFFFSSFKLGGITKDLMFLSHSPRETLRVGETKLAVSLGQSLRAYSVGRPEGSILEACRVKPASE